MTKSVSGSDVVLNWSANGESDIAGYKLYYGSPTGYSYSTTVDLGNVTTYTVTGGDIATEYAITAYDSSLDGTDDMVDGNESWFSVSSENTSSLSLNDLIDLKHSKVYPNPANIELNIELSNNLTFIKGDWWLLRTTLRYSPNLNIEYLNKNLSLQHLEFNFIQLVVYPQRLSKYKNYSS